MGLTQTELRVLEPATLLSRLANYLPACLPACLPDLLLLLPQLRLLPLLLLLHAT